jgi:hypothetical protein
VVEVQRLELGQPFEMFQSGVTDLSVRQTDILQLTHSFEIHESSIGDRGFFKVQVLESGEYAKARQVGVVKTLDSVEAQGFDFTEEVLTDEPPQPIRSWGLPALDQLIVIIDAADSVLENRLDNFPLFAFLPQPMRLRSRRST